MIFPNGAQTSNHRMQSQNSTTEPSTHIYFRKKLPNLVKGMKIKSIPNYALNCDVCIQGKMSNDRNKTLDHKATKIVALVHSDLAGPIQP